MFISKMSVKMNFRIITKNHAADPEIKFLTKSISKLYGHATALPTAWEITVMLRSESNPLLKYDSYNFITKTFLARNNIIIEIIVGPI